MPEEALIFDVFGTLVDWRSGVASAVSRALPKLDALAFADAWRGRYDPAMEEIRSGRRAYAPLDLLHRENLDATLIEFDADLSEPRRVDLARCWERLPAWPDVPPGLERLRSKFLLAPCSNASVALSTRLARFAGLRWDAIAGAEPARAYKPDAAVYRVAAGMLGLPPEHVTMVAAHNGDLAAAREAGLRTAFIPRPFEHGQGRKRDLLPSGPWSVIAEDLHGLADRLEC